MSKVYDFLLKMESKYVPVLSFQTKLEFESGKENKKR